MLVAMHRSLKFIAVLSAIVTVVYTGEEEKYSNKFDHVDVDAVLANGRLRNIYFHCLIGAGPCVTADAIFFKENFAEALATKCRKCTEKQLYTFDRIVDFYMKNEPENWDLIVKKTVENVQKSSKSNL